MTKEYIERGALIEFVKQNTPNIDGDTTMQCVERAMKAAPAADVVPVVHGRWNNIGVDEFTCSVCNKIVEYESRRCLYPFCPYCGADMRGE